MADRGEKSASRKTARDLPLTHRQHKATKRAQSGTKGASSSRHTRQPANPSAARTPQPQRPAPRKPAVTPSKPSGGPVVAQPRPAPSAAKRATPATPVKGGASAQTPSPKRRASAPPAQKPQKPQKPQTPQTPQTPPAQQAPAAPRRDRPPRKRAPLVTSVASGAASAQAPEAPVAPVTPVTPVTPVAPSREIPEIAIARPGDTESLRAAAQHADKVSSEPAVDAPFYSAALVAPSALAEEMSAASAEPVEPLRPVEPVVALLAGVSGVAEAPETPVEAPASSTASAARKMPTLAVMAALTQRPDPALSTGPLTRDRAGGAVDEPPSDATMPRMRYVRPTAPLTEDERLDPAALDLAATAPLDNPVDEPPALEEAPETPASSPAPFVNLESDASDHAPDDALADAFQETDAPTPEQALAGDAHAVEASPHAQSQAREGMWWSQAAPRRAAPQTRPIGMTSPLGARVEDEDEVTAPRATVGRPMAPSDLSGPRPWDAQTSPIQQTRQARHASPSYERGGPRGRERAEATEDVALHRATVARSRARAMRSPRLLVLSWTAGAHVAAACIAALIAVIAALRGSAGPDALVVFNWALALALIAGLGAALGYLCAQTRRPHLATFILALSQVAALAWALALLGPRASLMALAPAAAALALRGSGRLSAIVAAFGWMALFVLDEILVLTGALTPVMPLSGAGAILVDTTLPLVGVWLAVSILTSLYTSRLNAVARGRAVEHAALLAEEQVKRLRTHTEDDADRLRRALSEALRGEQPERVHARGALSVVADEVNRVADQLIDLRYDRAERKRLESAARRLTRVLERAWLGLSWSWPEATGTILDDLLALLRTPPPPDTPGVLDDTTPTGHVVAPHLFRGWQAPEPDPAAQRPPSAPSVPSLPNIPSIPSAPSMPSLWPSDPGAGLVDPFELPPSPRWRKPDASFDSPFDSSQRPGGANR